FAKRCSSRGSKRALLPHFLVSFIEGALSCLTPPDPVVLPVLPLEPLDPKFVRDVLEVPRRRRPFVLVEGSTM
ncbi:hypothetical protein PENTCL1PPCAC_22618, partial [Pristionchus entomophagus]